MKITTIRAVVVMAAAVALLVNVVPAHASRTDSRIESSARNSYVFKTYLKDDDIKVHAKDGAVTLTGSVSEESHKSLAEETVAGLPGVDRVDNRLEVKGTPPAANSDRWLAAKVKLTLLFHRNVSGSKTEVDAQNGIVTLRGEADSPAQIDLTTEYAKDVEGVKDVKNEMTVRAVTKTGKKSTETIGEEIDDASITAQVKLSLLNHLTTSALRTTVTAKRGVVTVGGKARNAAEKDLVSKLVGDIHGVREVNNRMTVE